MAGRKAKPSPRFRVGKVTVYEHHGAWWVYYRDGGRTERRKVADSRDDVTIYREYPAVPLSAVPHLGPAGSTAYKNLPDSNQCSLHSRLDVTQWTDVDAD